MKRFLISLTLSLMTYLAVGQMRSEVNCFNGLWHKVYFGDSTVVVIIPGSGEYLTTTTPSITQVSAVADKLGYGKYARGGKIYQHSVLTVVPPKGAKQADHARIAAQLYNLCKYYGFKRVVISGLSQGGQTVIGFLTGARTSSQINATPNPLPTSYLGTFDGYISLCGAIPGTAYWEKNKTKPLFLIAGIRDAPIPIIGNSVKIMNLYNKVATHKVYPNYTYKYVNGVVKWNPAIVPDTAYSRFMVIQPTWDANRYKWVGADHAASWIKGYDVNSTEGKAMAVFIKKTLNP